MEQAVVKFALDSPAFGQVRMSNELRKSQDTFSVGNIKGVGGIYQQTFIDTYSKVAFAKLYMLDRKQIWAEKNLRSN